MLTPWPATGNHAFAWPGRAHNERDQLNLKKRATALEAVPVFYAITYGQ